MTLRKRIYLIVALVAMMALAGAAVTVTSNRTSAQSSDSTPAVHQPCDDEDEADDALESAAAEADDDAIEEECGPQDEGDEADEADADVVQEPQLNGSVSVDESQYEGLSEADEATALASLATITSEQAASAAAQAEVPGDVQKVELDNENGSVVYSVEIGGKDVKVDAGTGAVLHIEADGAED